MAVLSASVPPDVKKISDGEVLSSEATVLRAFSSGTNIGSHVLEGIGSDPNRPAVRFSFSKLNTKEEIDFVIAKLKDLF